MNCQEITQIITEIKSSRDEFSDFVDDNEIEGALNIKSKLTEILNRQDILEVTEKFKMINRNQKLYDWLGVEVNISELYKNGELLDLSPESKEIAEREGYTQPIVILDTLDLKVPADEQLKLNNYFIREDYSPVDEGDEDKITSSPRPQRSYIVYTKPQELAKDAHSNNQPCYPVAFSDMAREVSAKNPDLDGYTRKEYLLHQIYHYLKNDSFMDDYGRNGGGVLLLAEQCEHSKYREPARVIGYHSDTYADTPFWLTWIYKRNARYKEKVLIRFLMFARQDVERI